MKRFSVASKLTDSSGDRFQSCGGRLLQHPKGIALACPIQYISLIGKVDIIAKGGLSAFPNPVGSQQRVRGKALSAFVAGLALYLLILHSSYPL